MSRFDEMSLKRGIRIGIKKDLEITEPPLTSDHNKPSHPAALSVEDLLRDCEIQTTRRSGPGGQHRNKVETAVCIKHVPTGLSAEAGERRSQSENKHEAIFRLRINLAVKHRHRIEREQQPSSLWQSRCRHNRISVNSRHADFPALLAEALDTIFAYEADVKSAAFHLQCSASQLLKLLRVEFRALEFVNRYRIEHSLQRLK